MGISSFFRKLLHDLSEDNYEQTVFDYRFWMKFVAAHGWIRDDRLYDDIQVSIKQDLVYPKTKHLIHPTSHLLIRLLTDVGADPVLSTYASSAHDQLCRVSLRDFVDDNLDIMLGRTLYDWELCRFYTNTNFLAHWINLGHLTVEDVRDRILQSLTSKPTVHPHQLNSLMILLKTSGATFAAYVDSSVMERCYDLLKLNKSGIGPVGTGLAEVRALILTIKKNYKR